MLLKLVGVVINPHPPPRNNTLPFTDHPYLHIVDMGDLLLLLLLLDMGYVVVVIVVVVLTLLL